MRAELGSLFVCQPCRSFKASNLEHLELTQVTYSRGAAMLLGQKELRLWEFFENPLYVQNLFVGHDALAFSIVWGKFKTLIKICKRTTKMR